MSHPTTETAVFVALLRGINVGGKHKLPMKDLAQIFTRAGGASVTTYINSGNVFFGAAPDKAAEIAAQAEREIVAQFGFAAPIVVCSAQEAAQIAKAHPFATPGTEAKQLYVCFLSGIPGAELVEKLDPNRAPGDVFLVQGRAVYLRLGDPARTKISIEYFEKVLQKTATMRNWNTTQKLAELSATP
jgi:uncharacterized protein (DUF1697 family)